MRSKLPGKGLGVSALADTDLEAKCNGLAYRSVYRNMDNVAKFMSSSDKACLICTIYSFCVYRGMWPVFARSMFKQGGRWVLFYGTFQQSYFQRNSRGGASASLQPQGANPAFSGGSCMLSKRVVLVVVALCCLFALTPSALLSQSSTTGAVSGLVTDPTGSVVPGATITLIQQETNATQSTTTDSSGRYIFPAASPATYTLKCTGKGFRTSTISHIVVEVLKSTTIDVKFEMGSQSEVVEVVASTGAELQTQDASIGTVISGDMLLRLPSQQRSITAILMQQPAVSPAGNQGDDINGGQVAGALVDQTTFFVDGGDATSDLEGTNSYVSPPGEPQPAPFIAVPAETVQEFRVVTANPTSSFARSQGGEVAVLTKSGTNSIHGSAYEYYYGSGTSANSWQLNSIGRHRPHSVNNRYGGSAGGPLLKDKLFVYGNYEARRFYQATTITQLVPTDSARQGILKFKDCAAGFDSTTGKCLGGNVVSYSLA